jgi:hypothetical protein
MLAVCAFAAIAASALASPQDDHGRHGGSPNDRGVKDQRHNKHGRHGDKAKTPKVRVAQHNGGGHHGKRTHNRYGYGAALGAIPYVEGHPRHGHGHPVYVVSHGRDDWRQIAVLAGLVAVIGLIENDKTLVFVGTAGALYSLDRYNHDRHSHDRRDRLRALYFSRPYFYRNGHRYHRVLVVSHRQKYYRFVRG